MANKISKEKAKKIIDLVTVKGVPVTDVAVRFGLRPHSVAGILKRNGWVSETVPGQMNRLWTWVPPKND